MTPPRSSTTPPAATPAPSAGSPPPPSSPPTPPARPSPTRPPPAPQPPRWATSDHLERDGPLAAAGRRRARLDPAPLPPPAADHLDRRPRRIHPDRTRYRPPPRTQPGRTPP